MSEYKIWHCKYDWRGGWGAYEEIDVVVVAETAGVALSLAVHEYPETKVDYWKAEEIPTAGHYVHHVSSATS